MLLNGSKVAQNSCATFFTMSLMDPQLEELVEEAAGINAVSKNKVGISKSMELVGFTLQQRSDMKIYQRVRRMAQKLLNAKMPPVPPVANVLPMASEPSSLTSGSRSSHMSGQSVSPNNVLVSAGDATTPARRQILLSTPPDSESPPPMNVSVPTKEKRIRRSSKEVQRQNSAKAKAKERNKAAMKEATQLIKDNAGSAKKKSINAIVKETNNRYRSNINPKTAARYVRLKLIGTAASPLKTGPVGDFPKRIYSALMGAYATYLKLEQAASKKQSTTKQLSKLVNATVNKGGFAKKREDLTRKLQRDTANQFDVGKANVIEQRRVMWTTAYNLDVWFGTWKETLVELGFAREKNDDDGCTGEVFFFPGQLHRIGNIDETDGSIDDTTGQRGGRPPMTFFSSDVSGGATAANKNGYSSTIICGSNAAGEPFPPHFQLKTLAQTTEGQRLSVDWFTHSKNVVAKFGFPCTVSLPCTFGMNEKAGMNSIELDKYIKNSILPLYPDIQDIKGKRVILKVDSGPGRMNVEMLADLRVQGLYLVPGVPNTTSHTQETDQSYGPFKSIYRCNIRTLSQARFDRGLSLQVTDLPLLVFGGNCAQTNAELRDAFSSAFSVAANINVWHKCGAVPLTRLPLLSKGVRHEVPIGAAALQVQSVAPEVLRLKNIESLNHFYCDVLTSSGYDGAKLRKDAPTRSTYVAVTEPQSEERVQAIKKAKTAGQMFFATGGRHVNTEQFFVSTELKVRDAKIKLLEDAKKDRAKYCKDQLEAVMLIRQKGDLDSMSVKKFTLPEVKVLLKWKKVKVTATKKRDLVDAYIAAPKPKIQKVWCRSEEAELVALKEQKVPLKDTALGVATTQMAYAVTNNLAKLDQNSMDALKTALQTFEDSKNPNVL